ncbi:Uncharacterised protein [Chlamydia trachomatis]|nr:Uncharacterised protein [Chlamydia trachomatis]
MDIHNIIDADITLDLANRFKEWKRLDIPYSTANFSDDYVGIRFIA